jgi:ribonucleotide reductase alpha subunit
MESQQRVIRKRDGSTQAFDPEKIRSALRRAFASTRGPDEALVEALVEKVAFQANADTVEGIQDLVEETLMAHDLFDVARHYIVYRREHAKERQEKGAVTLFKVPDEGSDVPWGELGYVTYKRTYARRMDPGDATEEWPDTIKRVLDACQTQLKCGFTQEELRRLWDHFMQLRGCVAGRFLWQLGTKTVSRLGIASTQNCSFVRVDELDAFTWAFDMLMLGSGVGFSIQKEHVAKLPPVVDRDVSVTRLDQKDADYIIPDSREGWVAFLDTVLRAFFVTGKSFTYSAILVRSAGTPIAGFGGVASGPNDLCDGIKNISDLLRARRGTKLSSVDCLDVMNIIASIVVSGNVRRSAMIAIGDCDDLEYLKSKRWDLGQIPNWRAMSNNSVVCSDIDSLPEEFWDGYAGKGEPFGLINLDLARRMGRLADGDRYPDPEVDGFNPCVSGDTMVLTSKGLRPVHKLVGRPFVAVVNGKEYPSTQQGFFPTGRKTVYELRLNNGLRLKATSDHKILTSPGTFMTVEQLSSVLSRNKANIMLSNNSNYAWMDTFAGSFDKGYAAGIKCTDEVPEDGSVEFTKGLLRALFDAHGTVLETPGGSCIRLHCYEPYKEERLSAVQRLLFALGISSMKPYMAGTLRILGRNECAKFRDVIGFGDAGKVQALDRQLGHATTDAAGGDALDMFEAAVESVTCVGEEDVFDCTIPGPHLFCANGMLISNCAEQGLANYETCCLAELFLPNNDSYDRICDVATLLYRICKHSLLLPCHHENTQNILRKNMRMGIGVSGYLQATEEQRAWLPKLYDHLRQFDEEYSGSLGIARSIKLTTVKPSGCSRGDTLVVTSKGILRLDEIADVNGPEWQDLTDIQVAGENEGSPSPACTKFFVNQGGASVPTKTIVLKSGMRLESTLTHRYRVLVEADAEQNASLEWKMVQDIQPGDVMPYELGSYLRIKQSAYQDLVTGPFSWVPQLTEDVAWFVGMYFGHGSNHSTGVSVVVGKSLEKKARRILSDVFRIPESQMSDEHYSTIVVRSMELRDWLETNGMLKVSADDEQGLEIPQIVRKSPASVIKAFLDGYGFCEGVLCTPSKKLAEQIVVCLRAAIGQPCTMTESSWGSDRVRYWVTKNEMLKGLQGLIWDSVVSVEDSSCATYDIEVPEGNAYIANGYVSHNTLSLLPGVTPGWHPSLFRNYIRRIRMSSNNPLLQLCKDHGYDTELLLEFDGTVNRGTSIVSFPCRTPDGVPIAKELNAVQELEIIKRLQTEWSDNAVSCTIYYRPHELGDIKQWLRANYRDSIKTVSFLLTYDHGFKQAPYEEISESEYRDMVARTRPIKGGTANGACDDDQLDTQAECRGGACPIR